MGVTFDLIPLSPAIGAEVHGVDLGAPLTDETISALRDAWLERQVLFFVDQDITTEQQLAFARRFGDLTEAHPVDPGLPDHPQVKPIDAAYDRTDFWHTDVTFMARPPMASILRAVEVPPVGGDTMWASLRCAYDTLATPLQQLCDGLEAWHHDEGFAARVERGEAKQWDGEPVGDRLVPVVHPVVRVHPETGRKNLFVNPFFTKGIVGFPADQSAALLRLLTNHSTCPDMVVRYRWKPGSVAFWDNRTTMHYGVFDYEGQRRLMHRVTLRGDVPRGPQSSST